MQQKNSIPKILIAVSGGPDSMFLATFMIRLFKEHNYSLSNLFLVHCNHKTRPETDQEEQFVRDYFKDYQLTVVTKPSTIKTTEAALRKRRYHEWKLIMEKYDIPKILLGHHFDDRVETTLLNLLRGCGISGFLGIKREEPHHLLGGRVVARPLLDYRKSDLLQRCKNLAIPYVEDQSNHQIQTSLRNKIRIEFLPLLYAQKGFETAMRKQYAHYEQNLTTVDVQPIKQSPYRNADRAYEICHPQIDITPEVVAQLLKQLHAASEMTSGTIQELQKFLSKSNNGRIYLQGITFFVAHGHLYAIKAPQRFREKTIDPQGEITTSKETQRFPQPGDRFKGKTRNKYCINQKIPLFRRNFIPVIVKDQWILSFSK